MKTNDLFEQFEILLASKQFDALSEAETALVMQFVSGPDEYAIMHKLMRVSKAMQAEAQSTPLPRGGSDEIWNQFASGKNRTNNTTKNRILKRKVSLLWPVGIAAALIVALFFRIPESHNSTNNASSHLFAIQKLNYSSTDTIVKEIPVYIGINQKANDYTVVDSRDNYPTSTEVHVPSVNSIQEQKAQRQGTNANELGELTKLTVAMN